MAVAPKPADLPALILLGLVAVSQHLGAEVGGLGVEQGHQVGLPFKSMAVVPCQWNRPEPGHHSLTLPMHLQNFKQSRRQPGGGELLSITGIDMYTGHLHRALLQGISQIGSSSTLCQTCVACQI